MFPKNNRFSPDPKDGATATQAAGEDSDLEDRCRLLLEELDLGDRQADCRVIPLAGGVSSDIARVDVGQRSYCLKFARSRLRVAEDWEAPVHRSRAEYEWLLFAATVARDHAPKLFGHSEKMHGFAMEYLAGEEVYLWKRAILDGDSRGEEAARVADLIGRIHAASAQTRFDRTPFENRDDFLAIRIEPYLSFTATRHPSLAVQLESLATRLRRADISLVHGDVSPKNIFIRKGKPILLDAECATMGDPAFDVAFCLNHLMIKALHLPSSRGDLLAAALAFWEAYSPHVRWEEERILEERVAQLLPALMLGRVDGKSPVEYLDEAGRSRLRQLSVSLFAVSPNRLRELVALLQREMGG